MTALPHSIGIFGFPKSGNNLANKIVNSIHSSSPEDLQVYDIHVALRSQSIIPKHPSLDYAVFKSHSAAPTNGSLNPHQAKASSIGVGETKKVILITRNPIDVMFSFINFRRLQVIKNRTIFNRSKFIRNYLGLSGPSGYAFFVESATYENLASRGSIKSAFHAYSVNGLSIPDLYGISGTWPSHLFSWTQNGYPTSEFLKIRYEDIFLAPGSVATALSNFLSVEFRFAQQAISFVNASALPGSESKGDEGEDDTNQEQPKFINRILPYYSLQYIEKPLIENFLARHHGLMKACGYEDFLDVLCSA